MSRAKGKRLTLARGVRFSCMQCGDCCRSFPISLSADEAERYEGRDWTGILGEHHPPVVQHVRRGGGVLRYLARRPDGACLFLGEDQLCEIHRHHGEPDKPLACRMFPFGLADGPEVEGTVVIGRFACSAVAHGEGETIQSHRKELDGLVREFHAIQPPRATSGPPRLPFSDGLDYGPDEVGLVLDLVASELENASRPFPERILAVSKFVSLVASSRFKSIQGGSAKKAIHGFAEGIHAQVGRGLLKTPEAAPLPQRLLFRQLLAMAARRDPARLVTAGPLRRLTRRIGNLLAGLAFMAGTGVVRCVGRDKPAVLGEVRRKGPPANPAEPAADGALTRYFLNQFTGRFLYAGSFQLEQVLPALGLLLRQYPLICLLARAACVSRGGERVERSDWVAAIRTADWNFGHVPWTRGPFGGLRGRLLGDVEVPLAFLPECTGIEPEPSPPHAQATR